MAGDAPSAANPFGEQPVSCWIAPMASDAPKALWDQGLAERMVRQFWEAANVVICSKSTTATSYI